MPAIDKVTNQSTLILNQGTRKLILGTTSVADLVYQDVISVNLQSWDREYAQQE